MFLIFFISFSKSISLVLFQVIFLLRLDSFAPKFDFVIKLACGNLAARYSVLFSTAFNAEIVARQLILCILLSISLTLAL